MKAGQGAATQVAVSMWHSKDDIHIRLVTPLLTARRNEYKELILHFSKSTSCSSILLDERV